MDSSWIYQAIQYQKGQFPQFVIGVGLLDSSTARADAKWWLEYCQREINVVLAILVHPGKKRGATLEK